jgi:hypothetical protein
MWKDWQDRDARNDDWDAGPAWSPEISLGDPESWRGTVHPAGERWRASEDDDQWNAWPEWSAGPEYRMWKRRVDDEQ